MTDKKKSTNTAFSQQQCSLISKACEQVQNAININNSTPAEPSEELEEAAIEFGAKQGIELKPFAIKFFKSGADWQKEQMMKGLCYETKVYRDEEGDGIDTPIESWLALENSEITNLPNIGLKDGDKVKVIIVKEDEPNIVNIEPPSFEESQGEVYNSYNVALNG